MAVFAEASSFVMLFISLCIFHALPICRSSLGFSAELIHRDSPKSPLYDPTSTTFSLLCAAVHRSAARANYFRNVSTVSVVNRKLYSSDVTNSGTEYLMSFYLGDPRTKVHAFVDTGSFLTWVQCKPCQKCNNKRALFDPETSSTYKIIPCQIDPCSTKLQPNPCMANYPCEYNINYMDGYYVAGRLSNETLGFDSSDGKSKVSVSGIIFGCTHRTNRQSKIAGAVGLNGDRISFARQLKPFIGSSKFSYCLPTDKGKSSRIYFGSEADVSGPGAMTTPLIISSFHNQYFLELEKIIVSGPAGTPPLVLFTKKQKKGVGSWQFGKSIMIDSGTMVTFIKPYLMKDLLKEVEKAVSNPQVEVPQHLAEVIDFCWDWRNPIDVKLMPKFIFYFTGNAKVEVTKPFSLLNELKIVCLNIASDLHTDGISILGSLAHSSYRTGYDLDAKNVTFLPKGC